MLRLYRMAAGRPCLLLNLADRLQEGAPLAALPPARYRRVGGTHGPSDDGSRRPLVPSRPPCRERRQGSWREKCRRRAGDRRRLCEESCALPAPKDFEPESPDSALSCLFVPNPIRKIRTYGIYGTA